MQGGVIELVIGYKRWRRQKYLLNRIDLPVLVRAYLTYPAIQVYFVLFAAGSIGCLYLVENWVPVALAAAAAVLIYPLIWYLLHRYVLHGAWLYKSRWTAALWKRIHFDHHQNPNDLAVLFGGLHTTLPTILVVTFPLGWLTAVRLKHCTISALGNMGDSINSWGSLSDEKTMSNSLAISISSVPGNPRIT